MKLRLPLLLLWCACGDGAQGMMTGFGESALATASGQHLSASVFTSPQPPQRGLVEAKLVLSGGDLSSATVAVTPWMPEHGHGTSVTPSVEAQGDGTYLITNLYLAMPGTWQLRVDVSGAVTDELVPSFDIP